MDTLARLWMKMTSFYGKLFINRFGKTDVTGMWFEALSNLSEREIDYGMSRIIKADTNGDHDKFPPNPAQFRQLCLSNSSNKIPSVGAAFDEAELKVTMCMPQWSHPIVKLAAEQLGIKKLIREPRYITYPQFIAIYEELSKQERLSNTPKTITSGQFKQMVDRESATKHRANLLRSIN